MPIRHLLDLCSCTCINCYVNYKNSWWNTAVWFVQDADICKSHMSTSNAHVESIKVAGLISSWLCWHSSSILVLVMMHHLPCLPYLLCYNIISNKRKAGLSSTVCLLHSNFNLRLFTMKEFIYHWIVGGQKNSNGILAIHLLLTNLVIPWIQQKAKETWYKIW